ncbi:MAG: hypothetical protein HAW66_04705, partial [Shewanella sp.]|nr:hypothetical protein [Shewanella sp.]
GDSTTFAIDNSGQITVADKTALDFETTPSYALTVQIGKDDAVAVTATITITITDVDEARDFNITGIDDDTVKENASFTSATPTLTGETPIGAVTYTLSGDDVSAFTIDPATGTVTSTVVFDFETLTSAATSNVYSLIITATDADQNSDTANFTVTVTDEIETATFTIDAITPTETQEGNSFTSGTPKLSGEAPIGVVIWSLSGTDSAEFTIDPATGIVSSLAALEFDETIGADNTYQLTITATDADQNNDSAELPLSVIDTDALFQISGIEANTDVPENTSFSATATATDTVRGTIVWSIKGVDSSTFTIAENSGVITSNATFDFENPTDNGSDNSYNITIVGTDDNGAKELQTTITIIDVIENADFNITIITDSTIAENTSYTSATPILTGDAPIGDIAYSLSGSDTNAFTINSTTGVITANAEFDYDIPTDDDADNVYNLTITVTDADNNTASKTIAITITNIIEKTIGISDQTRAIAENAVDDDIVGDALIATGEPTAFSITAGDTTAFTIDNTGQISIAKNNALDFETTPSYTLTVQISKVDAANETATITITISIAKYLHPGQTNNLDALCKRYGIDNSRRELHGALLEAEILADVYLLMTGGQTKFNLNSDK